MNSLREAFRGRFAPVLALYLLTIGVAFLTRVVLLLRPDVQIDGGLADIVRIFAFGLYYDIAVASYASLPFVLWLVLLPQRVARSWFHVGLLAIGFTATAYGLLLVALSEWIFWDEFGARFNFIAVDYLVYSHEVLGNIWQSYPVGKLLTVLLLPAFAIGFWVTRSLGPRIKIPSPLGWRLAGALPFFAVAAFSVAVVASEQKIAESDAVTELSGDGIHEFFSAFRNNVLDYERFYATLAPDFVAKRLREMLTVAGERWPAEPSSSVERVVLDPRPERHLNVVLISIESMGAEFFGQFGNPRGLTPVLDALAKDSLAFMNVYATGNRTVRGLEALSLAIPPTPGQSIVKRPGSENLFTLGSVFEDRGYATRFIYGGYSYFDNMGGFFSANSYKTVDRSAFAKERVAYENIWGIADENLFDLTLDELDALEREQRAGGKKRFFAHVLTTSNHRPYTYPPGRIDIPSGTGRDGAVKYSDFAVGHFLEGARKRAWFADTLFVITADHGANARGGAEIPVPQYRVPLLFYAPGHIRPGVNQRLMSHIDIAPTILGQLHFSYVSKFFGRDIDRTPPGEERAFVGNYQTLGYLKDGRMVTLTPQRRSSVRTLPGATEAQRKAPRTTDDKALLEEAITWYQASARAWGDKQFGKAERNRKPATAAMTLEPTHGAGLGPAGGIDSGPTNSARSGPPQDLGTAPAQESVSQPPGPRPQAALR